MRLRHCRNRHPGLPRLFHNEPLLLRRPELTDPSSSNNRLSRFHRVPRTHGIKPCLQRACRKKNALSRRPTVDAYRFHEFGAADVLKIEDLEVREPGANEVRIKVAAIGMNFAEVMWRRNQYIETPQLPASLGYEVS